MILYYVPIGQNTVDKTVSNPFYRDSAYLNMYVHIFTIFLFIGLKPVFKIPRACPILYLIRSRHL